MNLCPPNQQKKRRVVGGEHIISTAQKIPQWSSSCLHRRRRQRRGMCFILFWVLLCFHRPLFLVLTKTHVHRIPGNHQWQRVGGGCLREIVCLAATRCSLDLHQINLRCRVADHLIIYLYDRSAWTTTWIAPCSVFQGLTIIIIAIDVGGLFITSSLYVSLSVCIRSTALQVICWSFISW